MAIAVSIVEDDAGPGESICRFIQGAPGFQCLGAYASAQEALADVPNRPPAVVLMDINLPKMSGREQQVLELLSERRAYKQITVEMNLSMGTIRTYIRRIYEKLHVNCRTDPAVMYLDATSPERHPILGA